MRELRIGSRIAAVALLTAFGCDDGRDGDGDEDGGGVPIVDSGGGGGTDSGPPEDSGMTTMPDSGGTTGSCGFPGECDLLDPSSCAAGTACVLRIETEGGPATPRCQPAGTGTDGTACTSGADCAEGFDCSQFEQVCRRNCCTNADCNPPGAPTGQICNRFGNAGPEGDEAGICRASDPCDLVDGSGCDDGETCTLLGPINVCGAAGTGTAGAECAGGGTGCVGGHACLRQDAGGPPTCHKLCNIEDGTGCAGSETCSGRIGDGSGVARTDVGFCQPPA